MIWGWDIAASLHHRRCSAPTSRCRAEGTLLICYRDADDPGTLTRDLDAEATMPFVGLAPFIGEREDDGPEKTSAAPGADSSLFTTARMDEGPAPLGISFGERGSRLTVAFPEDGLVPFGSGAGK